MTIINCILQAKKLEQGEGLSLDQFYQSIPFMGAEIKGETGAAMFNKLKPPKIHENSSPF